MILLGSTWFSWRIEQGSTTTFSILHFLTETKINRDHQRLLALIRKTLGSYMCVGWYTFWTPSGLITAGSLVKGLEQLEVEIRKFIKEPMEAYEKVCLIRTHAPHAKIFYLTSFQSHSRMANWSADQSTWSLSYSISSSSSKTWMGQSLSIIAWKAWKNDGNQSGRFHKAYLGLLGSSMASLKPSTTSPLTSIACHLSITIQLTPILLSCQWYYLHPYPLFSGELTFVHSSAVWSKKGCACFDLFLPILSYPLILTSTWDLGHPLLSIPLLDATWSHTGSRTTTSSTIYPSLKTFYSLPCFKLNLTLCCMYCTILSVYLNLILFQAIRNIRRRRSGSLRPRFWRCAL